MPDTYRVGADVIDDGTDYDFLANGETFTDWHNAHEALLHKVISYYFGRVDHGGGCVFWNAPVDGGIGAASRLDVRDMISTMVNLMPGGTGTWKHHHDDPFGFWLHLERVRIDPKPVPGVPVELIELALDEAVDQIIQAEQAHSVHQASFVVNGALAVLQAMLDNDGPSASSLIDNRLQLRNA